MDKKELLKSCSFYHGEQDYPEKLNERSPFAFLFWEAEQNFVLDSLSSRNGEAVRFYKENGLTDLIPERVLPLGLAASLFASYCHASPDLSPVDRVINFKGKFLPSYLGLTKI